MRTFKIRICRAVLIHSFTDLFQLADASRVPSGWKDTL